MELIKITEKNGNKVVSARELHTFLGAGSNISTWFKNQAERAMLDEGIDFIQISEQSTGGRPSIDYAVNLSSAKEIAMLNGGEKGKEARLYFIACEKQVKRVLSPAEALLQQVYLMVEVEQRQKVLESKIDRIEARITTHPSYFTIAGYGTLNRVTVNLKLASDLGRKASKICNTRGLMTDTTPDPRFGLVKMYPEIILKEVFAEYLITK
jgi:anti-repressor protein